MVLVGSWGEKVVRKVRSDDATGLGRSAVGEGGEVRRGEVVRARSTALGKRNPLRSCEGQEFKKLRLPEKFSEIDPSL